MRVNNDMYEWCNIYISAQSDDTSFLASVYIVTAKNSKSLLNIMQDNLQNTGEIQGYPVDPPAYLTTSLSDNEMKQLNGVIYLSSAGQRVDSTFHVYDIYQARKMNIIANGYSTFLFLNSNMQTKPSRSSIISDWNQIKGSSGLLYAGFPLDSKVNVYPIFSNPITIQNSEVLFPNVETFSLSLAAFYITTNNGFSFKIKPGYYNINGTNTTSVYSTTGFYMKPAGEDDSTIVVNIENDIRCSGTSGASVVGHFPTGGNVTVGFYNGMAKYEQSAPPEDYPSYNPWTIPFIGQHFKVSSTNGTAGQYYVQYFVNQRPPRQTTPPETTTKSAGAVKLFTSVVTLLMYWL